LRNDPSRRPAAAFAGRLAAASGFTLFSQEVSTSRGFDLPPARRRRRCTPGRLAAPPASEARRRPQRETRVRSRRFPRQVRRRPGVMGLRTTKHRICGCRAALPRPNRACHPAERGEVALFGRCVLRQKGPRRREKADAHVPLCQRASAAADDERLGLAPIVRSGKSRHGEHNATSHDRGRVFDDSSVRSCACGLGCSPWGWLEPSGR